MTTSQTASEGTNITGTTHLQFFIHYLRGITVYRKVTVEKSASWPSVLAFVWVLRSYKAASLGYKSTSKANQPVTCTLKRLHACRLKYLWTGQE